jgi:hypothetical protein
MNANVQALKRFLVAVSNAEYEFERAAEQIGGWYADELMELASALRDARKAAEQKSGVVGMEGLDK